MSAAAPLLEIDDLRVHFDTDEGLVRAVDGVSYAIGPGETLAVVGESGSGKSVTSLAVMDLLPGGRRAVKGGAIRFKGENLLEKTPEETRNLRGNRIAMIFQEPMSSLNPVFTVGWQITEAIERHLKLPHAKSTKRAVELLELVGIPEPQERYKNYPHQLSGGMRQRAMIAMALSCDPELLIADEPTTALDVTIQAQILQLMQELQSEIGMSILFITHDLSVVAELADRVVVMYAGRAVESGDVFEIFEAPRMPYTMGLLASIPGRHGGPRRHRLDVIPGNVPNPLGMPRGCAFHPRCSFREPRCREAVPPLEGTADGHQVRCIRWREIAREHGREPALETAS